MTLTELASVETGPRLGSVRYRGGAALVESTLAEGVPPKSSSLSAEDAHSYVVTDDIGRDVVALGLEHIHDGRAELGLESRDGDMSRHLELMRSVVRDAMHRNGVLVGVVGPELVDMLDMTPGEWQQMGFLPDASSTGGYSITGA